MNKYLKNINLKGYPNVQVQSWAQQWESYLTLDSPRLTGVGFASISEIRTSAI
jgi:hypothetical protein